MQTMKNDNNAKNIISPLDKLRFNQKNILFKNSIPKE